MPAIQNQTVGGGFISFIEKNNKGVMNMRSVKNKITTITMCIAIIAMGISAAVGVMALRSVGISNAD